MYSVTNSTCFLCLREILCVDTLDNQVDGVTQTENLNSSPHLSIKIEAETHSSLPSPGKISLKSIFRYIGLNFKQIITNFGNGDVVSPQEQIVSDCSALFCRLCSKIIEPLSKLCMELELIEMKVDYHLKSVRGILDHSETHADNQFGHMMTAADLKKQEFNKFLRNELKRKCEFKISQIMPIVALINDPTLHQRNATFAATPAPKIAENENATITTPCPSPLNSDITSEEDSSSAIDLPTQEPTPGSRSRSKILSKYQPCSECNPPQMVLPIQRRRHVILFHLETFFLSSKLSHVPTADFKKYCEHVLHAELLSFKKVHDAKEASKSTYKCSYCSNVSTIYCLRTHVCSRHQEQLSQKLIDLQRTTTTDQLKAMQLQTHPQIDPLGLRRREWKCNVCNEAFPYLQSLAKHKMLIHGIGGDVATRRFIKCDICSKRFKLLSSLLKHKKAEHRGAPLYYTKCEFCAKTFRDPYNFSKHQNRKRSKCSETRGPQKSVTEDQDGSKGPKYNRIRKYTTCTQCDPPRKVETALQRRHKIVYHLESWFVSSMQPHVTISDFKKYCEHVVQVELLSSKKLYGVNGAPNGKCQCPHCPLASVIPNLRTHLCGQHKNVLSQKLTELQSSTTIAQLDAVQLPSASWSKVDKTKPRSLEMYKCDKCGDIFQWIETLQKHKVRMHGRDVAKKPTLKCEICGKAFFYLHNLQNHHKRVHEEGGIKIKACEFCGTTEFQDCKQLLSHKKAKHPKEMKSLKCDICGDDFQRVGTLVRHKRLKHQKEYSGVVEISKERLKSKGRCKKQEAAALHPNEAPFLANAVNPEEEERALEMASPVVESPLEDPLELSKVLPDESFIKFVDHNGDDYNEAEEHTNEMGQVDNQSGDFVVEMKVFPEG